VGAPRLVVVMVVDQMRADYLDRFDILLTGGLGTFLESGVRFTEAHHRHAITNTGPGHATISTGCDPARHGIITNYWLDRQRGDEVYALDEGAPTRLECSTLGDWLKSRYRDSKVYSVAGKDRSAVLLAGREADGAYFYDWNGGFETSAYYSAESPAWLENFNSESGLARRFGAAWTPQSLDRGEIEKLGVETTDMGPLRSGFPHVFGGASLFPGESFFNALFTSPWLDALVADLAIRMIETEGLGADAVPDLLAVGFSALDSAGHRYGPDSPEVLDTILALDKTLDKFLGELDQRIGLEHVLIALTSDHGAVQLPEVRQGRGLSGRRIGSEEILCLQGIEKRLDEKLAPSDWLRAGPVLNDSALEETGIARTAAEAAVAEALEACPSVARAWTRGELLTVSGDEPQVGVAAAFARSYHPNRSPDVLIQWDEHFMPYPATASTHGSVYRYDTWVPMILMGANLSPGWIETPAATTDLAPTLAGFAGVAPPDEIDGVDLGPSLADRKVVSQGKAGL